MLESLFEKIARLSGPHQSGGDYTAQGNLDLWKKTLDEYLKEDVQDLDHARIKVNIARYLMQKNDFKSARPYADAAAKPTPRGR